MKVSRQDITSRARECIVAIMIACATIPMSAQHFGFSSGLYRVPYATGILVEVGSDVYTHDPLGKYDLLTAASNPTIVAAADGWVRWIQESFDTSCYENNGGIVTCCWQQNNYVIIEHPNGEWSQYTHMDEGSVTDAGISLNEWVTAGTPIGTEGTVGCSTGDHLHLEVSRPFDPDFPFDTIGGFLDQINNVDISEMLIPVIGGIGTLHPWMEEGDAVVAGPMDDNCPATTLISGTVNGELVSRADDYVETNDSQSFTVTNNGSAIFRAGDYVLFHPGVHIQAGSKFKALIRTCNQQN